MSEDKLVVPLEFWFNKNPSLSLPLIATKHISTLSCQCSHCQLTKLNNSIGPELSASSNYNPFDNIELKGWSDKVTKLSFDFGTEYNVYYPSNGDLPSIKVDLPNIKVDLPSIDKYIHISDDTHMLSPDCPCVDCQNLELYVEI